MIYELKREQYLNIQAWMITDLELTGNDLIVYAIIYGFSQDGDNLFMGNRSYLAAWCRCSERSIQRNINNLIERGLIEQAVHSSDNRKVYYRALTSDKMSLVTKCHQTSDKMSPVLVTKCHQTSDKMSPAYIDNIKDKLKDNINDSECDIVVCETTKPTRFQKPTFEEVKQYIEENGYTSVDPDRFYSYYEANGWKVGRNSMKDFKAAVRMWSARDKNDQKKRPAEVKYLENEYTPEHLKQREEESQKLLDDLLKED